jgi:sporulation protein YlmC with PRC-barrel domain
MKMINSRRLTIPILVSALCVSMGAYGGDKEESSTSSSSSSSQASQQEKEQSQQQARPASELSTDELKITRQELDLQVTDANKASKLIGMSVKNKKDEDLGKIKELVLDLKSGKVAYAVLSHGSTLGFGGKNVAVPFQALSVKPGERALLLDIDKQELAQAPGFNDKQWPDLNAAATGKTIGLASSGSDTNAASPAAGGSESSGESTSQGASSSSSQIDTNSASSTNLNASPTGGSESAGEDKSSSGAGSSFESDTNSASATDTNSASSQPE